MSIATVEAWVKDTIETVTGYHVVYPHERIITNYDDLLTDFGTGVMDPDNELYEQTKGWMVSVIDRTTEQVTPRGGGVARYTVLLHCLWSVHSRGASESDFDAHVLAVVEALGAVAIPNTLTDAFNVGIPQIERIGVVEWPLGGGRLHHRADLRQVISLNESLRD